MKQLKKLKTKQMQSGNKGYKQMAELKVGYILMID